MGRSPCCEKVGLKKGPWTNEEDDKLKAYIEEHGHGSWRALPAKAGLQRCGKSCRLRWTNYLRPDIKRGKFSLQEEQTIIQLHALLGNRWSAIATHLPKRTDNEIKNYWNTHLKKRLTKMGIDPVTHKPKTDSLGAGSGNPKDAANISHMAQWESARLEAEARLVRESKQLVSNHVPLIHHQLGGSTTNTSQAPHINRTATAPPPCLDVLKAWQGTWMKTITRSENTNNTLSSLITMDDLESPTSTLNFPGCTDNSMIHNNPYSIQAVNGFCGSGMIKEFDGHGCDISVWNKRLNNININTPTPMEFDDQDQDHDMSNYGCAHDNNAISDQWFTQSYKARNDDENVSTLPTSALSNIMELGFEDNVFVYNNCDDQDQNINNSNMVSNETCHQVLHAGDGSCESGNVFEESKICWNSIFNLVNASPSDVF